jgi:hypothetical protein
MVQSIGPEFKPQLKKKKESSPINDECLDLRKITSQSQNYWRKEIKDQS